MKALLTVEPFDRLGTEGRRIIKVSGQRSLLKEVQEYQRAWEGKAIQVEEWSYGSFYGPPTNTWVYRNGEVEK